MLYTLFGFVLLLGAALVYVAATAFRSEHLVVIHHRPKARVLLERARDGGYQRRGAGHLPLAVLRFGWLQLRRLLGRTPARAAARSPRVKRPATIAVNVKPCA